MKKYVSALFLFFVFINGFFITPTLTTISVMIASATFGLFFAMWHFFDAIIKLMLLSTIYTNEEIGKTKEKEGKHDGSS